MRLIVLYICIRKLNKMKKLLFILLAVGLYSCNTKENVNIEKQYEFYTIDGIKVENVNLMKSLKNETKLYRLDLNTNKLELY